MSLPIPVYADVDPFDLPEWLGTADVIWNSESGRAPDSLVRGELVAGEDHVACDLLAVDEAYPTPVVDAETRVRAHQAWHHGEVLLLCSSGDRLTLAVPGRRFDAALVLDASRRLAKAVGAVPESWAVLLHLGAVRI